MTLLAKLKICSCFRNPLHFCPSEAAQTSSISGLSCDRKCRPHGHRGLPLDRDAIGLEGRRSSFKSSLSQNKSKGFVAPCINSNVFVLGDPRTKKSGANCRSTKRFPPSRGRDYPTPCSRMHLSTLSPLSGGTTAIAVQLMYLIIKHFIICFACPLAPDTMLTW